MILINKDTKLYCSFAKVAGSKGCAYHNSNFQKLECNAIYKSFSVNNIEEALASMKTLNIMGAGITMPYKVEALKYVDKITEETEYIGATNTILNKGGILEAHNTDWLAARDLLVEYPQYDSLWILGSGGYARAVEYACSTLGIKVQKITRDTWENISTLHNCLVFNCTPVASITDLLCDSITYIDCITSTESGKKLSETQAAYQAKLYND